MEDLKRPDEADFKQQVSELRTWLEQKSYVPKNVDEKLYRRFVHSCYYDLEKAKTAADLFFSIRSSAPEMFTDRDPLSSHIQKTLKITHFGRYMLSRNRLLWIWQLDDPGLQQYDHLLEAKIFNLAVDAWFMDDDSLVDEDVIVTDVKDLSLRILTKFSFSVAKKMSRYQQEAIPLRLKQIHLINAPSVIYRIFSLLKPFISKDIMKLVHIHTPNSTTLFDYFSKDELPEDFGGTRGRLSGYAAETVASIMKNREYLIDENFWRCDPSSKKQEKFNSKPVAEVTPDISSLRTLAID